MTGGNDIVRVFCKKCRHFDANDGYYCDYPHNVYAEYCFNTVGKGYRKYPSAINKNNNCRFYSKSLTWVVVDKILDCLGVKKKT